MAVPKLSGVLGKCFIRDLRLNKVNMFIGSQGSGKSTIVIILSFCSWLEKVNECDRLCCIVWLD